jgi:hypothetical protein
VKFAGQLKIAGNYKIGKGNFRRHLLMANSDPEKGKK